MARTRLSVDGYGAQRAGSFSGKVVSGGVGVSTTLRARPRSFVWEAESRTFVLTARGRIFTVRGRTQE